MLPTCRHAWYPPETTSATIAPSASAEYRGSTTRNSSASRFGNTATHSTTRPPSQHAIARHVDEVGGDREAGLDAGAGVAGDAGRHREARRRRAPAATIHHGGQWARGSPSRRCSSIRRSGNATTSSASRTSATFP